MRGEESGGARWGGTGIGSAGFINPSRVTAEVDVAGEVKAGYVDGLGHVC